MKQVDTKLTDRKREDWELKRQQSSEKKLLKKTLKLSKLNYSI